MKYGALVFEEKEYEQISDLLHRVEATDPVLESCYNKLKLELKTASVRNSADMPADVIRLGSVLTIETPIGMKEGYSIVLPNHSNPAQMRLSILTPMGSALIGYAQGDKVDWYFPSGPTVIEVLKVEN